MARRKNAARSPSVAPKKRPDPAEEAESRLRHLHAVGREALARFPVGAAIDPDTVHEIADREGLRLDNMQRARQFARTYSEKDLEDLCRLRTPGGMPLSWGHVRRLVSIPNKAKRAALQKRSAREGWTAAQLSDVIQREVVGRKRRYGGRPFTAPRTLEEGLRQVVLRSEEWLRRCRESWSVEAAWLAAGAEGSKDMAAGGSRPAGLEVARRVLLEGGRAALEREARLAKVTLAADVRGGEPGPADGPAVRGGRLGGRVGAGRRGSGSS